MNWWHSILISSVLVAAPSVCWCAGGESGGWSGVTDRIPVPPGMTAQQYRVEYQSGLCRSTNSLQCVYGVRIAPSDLPTAIRWEDPLTEFVLARGRIPDDGQWKIFRHDVTGEEYKGKAKLSYGLNADEYRDQILAWLDNPNAVPRATANDFQYCRVVVGPLCTAIDGVFADGSGRLVPIKVEVVSECRNVQPYTLRYTIRIHTGGTTTVLYAQAAQRHAEGNQQRWLVGPAVIERKWPMLRWSVLEPCAAYQRAATAGRRLKANGPAFVLERQAHSLHVGVAELEVRGPDGKTVLAGCNTYVYEEPAGNGD